MTERVRVGMTLEQCWHRVPGGTAVAAIGMARALRERGNVDTVGVAARHGSPAPSAWTPPVPVEHLSLPRIALYESWHRFRRPGIESATGPVDVIHATSLAVPPRSTSLVVTVHDLAFLHEPDHFTKRGLRFFDRGLELARQDADVVHCPSQATADDCAANGFDPTRIRVIPLGVDPIAYDRTSVDDVLQRLGIRRPYVLWTGTIEPRKNLRGLLAAWRAAKRSEETLVLVGPEGWREDLGDDIADAERVRSVGFVDRTTLGALYGEASAFCWPSLREGFGFPVLEAMAQGCPVITSLGTSTAEIAGDAAKLVDPLDTDGIAAALNEVLDDPATAQKLAEQGRIRAAGYTWERTAELLEGAYAGIGVAA